MSNLIAQTRATVSDDYLGRMLVYARLRKFRDSRPCHTGPVPQAQSLSQELFTMGHKGERLNSTGIGLRRFCIHNTHTHTPTIIQYLHQDGVRVIYEY